MAVSSLMNSFSQRWHDAAVTSVGFFWMAFWAFGLGYLVSSLIQVLVTRARMQKAMGGDGPKSMALGTFFGFISSSCSFAALATTRALFQKGAGLASSLAFLLASTNLVIELGIVIVLFLSWQFVVGEYVGGLILILFAWMVVRATNPETMIEQARERLGDDEEMEGDSKGWRKKVLSREGWERIGRTYVMEWQMVWKDVLIGFTVAGIISAFVPDAFFQAMFVGSGGDESGNPGFLAVLEQTLIGPLAAFCTFIGSMGNIPLAAVLYGHGVSYAGVMAFIFSDLVVLPVLRINAAYYGWKMALYILGVLLGGLVVASIAMHYGLAALGMLPEGGSSQSPREQNFFAFDYGFVLNLVFLAVSLGLGWLWWRARRGEGGHQHGASASLGDRVLLGLAIAAMIWLVGGLILPPMGS